MPKPATLPTWATDATFASGPDSGQPVIVEPSAGFKGQGNVPGNPYKGAHENWRKNLLFLWASWANDGRAIAEETAHIVESNASGRLTATHALFSGHSTDGPTLQADSPTVAGPTVVIAGTHAGLGNAPLLVTASAAVADPAIGATHSGTGAAVNGTNLGTGPGGDFRSADVVTAAASLRLGTRGNEPQPSVQQDGDVYYNSGDERLRTRIAGAWRSQWHSTEGLARRYAEDLTETSTALGGSNLSKVDVVYVAGDNLRTGSTVHVRAVMELGVDTLTAGVCNVGIEDITAAVFVVANRSPTFFHVVGAAEEKYVTIEGDYTIPADGARTFRLGFISDGGLGVMFIRNATLEVTGQYG